MLKIVAPYNFEPEKKYIIDILLSEFLGLSYELQFVNTSDYQIIINNKKIVFKDIFFMNFTEDAGYLNKQNIPENIRFTKNEFIVEDDIPVIFGTNEFLVSNNIFCGIDIFASSFFMLTRWEEFAIIQKDAHNRFPCELSLAQKNNFHHRPVINEYVEMLWNMLKHIGCNKKRKQHKFEIIPTHDIDFFRQFPTFSKGIKNVLGDLIKRKSITLAFDTFKRFIQTKFFKKKDPFDTFNLLMDISEKHNLKSHFYFIAGRVGEEDVHFNFTTDEVKKTIKQIHERGHIVGIHGGYSSYDEVEQFQKEIKRFEQFDVKITEGRQHFLRFKNAHTWQIHEQCKVKYDSTIGYTNTSGFRAGTCYEYPVFDIINRQQLNLIERPLIFMETVSQKKYSKPADFKNQLLSLKSTVQKYNGQFVVLWHNSNINSLLWQKYFSFYKDVFV